MKMAGCGEQGLVAPSNGTAQSTLTVPKPEGHIQPIVK